MLWSSAHGPSMLAWTPATPPAVMLLLDCHVLDPGCLWLMHQDEAAPMTEAGTMFLEDFNAIISFETLCPPLPSLFPASFLKKWNDINKNSFQNSRYFYHWFFPLNLYSWWNKTHLFSGERASSTGAAEDGVRALMLSKTCFLRPVHRQTLQIHPEHGGPPCYLLF